jgi:hypothetical protein
MPDITMCVNEDCILRHDCYRKKAKPGPYQSWAHFKPENGDCKDFIEAKAKSQVRRLDAQAGRK